MPRGGWGQLPQFFSLPFHLPPPKKIISQSCLHNSGWVRGWNINYMTPADSTSASGPETSEKRGAIWRDYFVKAPYSRRRPVKIVSTEKENTAHAPATVSGDLHSLTTAAAASGVPRRASVTSRRPAMTSSWRGHRERPWMTSLHGKHLQSAAAVAARCYWPEGGRQIVEVDRL